jgi:hypothetical protein
MQNILSAQTLVETPADTALATVPADSLAEDVTAIVPTESKRRSSRSSELRNYLGIFNNENKVKEDKKILASSRSELVMLSMKLKRYRESLRPSELEEFNGKYTQQRTICHCLNILKSAHFVFLCSTVGFGRGRKLLDWHSGSHQSL